MRSPGTANLCPNIHTMPRLSPKERYPSAHASGTTNQPRAMVPARSRSPRERPRAATDTKPSARIQNSSLWSLKTSVVQRGSWEMAPSSEANGLWSLSASSAPPPAFDLALELSNPDSQEKILYLADERTKLSLAVQGPGVVRLNAPRDVAGPCPRKTIRLTPGQTLPLPVRHLIDGSREQVEYVYWTEPGDYTLTIRLRVPTSEEALNGTQPGLPVKDLDCATYVSRPVRIKVIEKR